MTLCYARSNGGMRFPDHRSPLTAHIPNPQYGAEQRVIEVVHLGELETAFFRDEVVELPGGGVRILPGIRIRDRH